MPVLRCKSLEDEAQVEKALRILGVPVDAQFIGLTWGKFMGEGIDDWQAESVIVTPDADPFLARAASLTLTQDILETNYARMK